MIFTSAFILVLFLRIEPSIHQPVLSVPLCLLISGNLSKKNSSTVPVPFWALSSWEHAPPLKPKFQLCLFPTIISYLSFPDVLTQVWTLLKFFRITETSHELPWQFLLGHCLLSLKSLITDVKWAFLTSSWLCYDSLVTWLLLLLPKLLTSPSPLAHFLPGQFTLYFTKKTEAVNEVFIDWADIY